MISAAGGPVGSAIGAVLGGIGGAKGGDEVAEYVNPTKYDEHWQREYKNASYYQKDRDWKDYSPAYGLGYHAKGARRNERFDDVENDLERKWDQIKGESRLKWAEARDAVLDGWHHVERALPGDDDGDGR